MDHGLRRGLQRRTAWSRLVGGLGLLAVALAACADSTPDYRANRAIIVNKQSFSLSLDVSPTGEPLSRLDTVRLETFADSFLARGEGQMELVIAEGKSTPARILAITEKLKGLGLQTNEITPQILPVPKIEGKDEAETGSTVLLNFRGYIAQVPQCGDWSDNSSRQPENGPTDNYGCATQRNIGLMVRNPRDLIRSRTAQARDGARASGVVGAYQQGKNLENPAEVSKSISEVGRQ